MGQQLRTSSGHLLWRWTSNKKLVLKDNCGGEVASKYSYPPASILIKESAAGIHLYQEFGPWHPFRSRSWPQASISSACHCVLANALLWTLANALLWTLATATAVDFGRCTTVDCGLWPMHYCGHCIFIH